MAGADVHSDTQGYDAAGHPGPARVAVVGAGPAGTLVAAALARLGALPTGLEVLLVDDDAGDGRGTAFSTSCPDHLLNVRARDLSARPEVAGDFVDWVRAHRDPAAGPDDFLPRGWFGDYLAALQSQLLAPDATDATDAIDATGVTVRRVPAGALAVDESGEGAERRTALVLRSGERLPVDAVVLAVGTERPGLDWVPPTLLASDRLVADPWRPGALDRPAGAPPGTVLVVGTGLTMADIALTVAADGDRVVALSRRGRLPLPHSAQRRAPRPSTALTAAIGDQVALPAERVERLVREHLLAGARGGDWRPAMDGLRPLTALLWQRVPEDERRALLRDGIPAWEVRRHRMPPATAAALARLRREGRLEVRRGEVADVEPLPDGRLLVALADGGRVVVDRVVNATGPEREVSRSRNPVVVDLLASGLGTAGPLGMGLATDPGGRLLGRRTAPAVWAVGALRRGELWETTAVPELRAQAVSVAAQVVARLRTRPTATGPASRPQVPRRDRPSRPLDRHGNPLTTTAEAAAAFDRGLLRVLRVQSGAEEAFAEAVRLDGGFALGHAALALVTHELGSTGDPAEALATARATLDHRATDRERSLVDVVTRRLHGTRLDGDRALRAHVDAFPRDGLAVSVAVPTIAFSGVTDLQHEAWALVESLRPAWGDDWFFTGLLAFVRQEQGRYDEADRLSARSLAREPGAGHAVHARTHVFYETGAHAEGLRWLDGWIRGGGHEASHRAHFAWHAALHELALGSVEDLRRRYEAQLAPPMVSGVRALVDSASLLWRCRVTGSWDDELPVRAVLDSVDDRLLAQPTTPFTALHAAVALAAARDVAGLARLRAHAAARPHPVMRDVVVALCDALTAVAEERWDDAVRTLRLLGPWVAQLGGSDAQREVVEETLLLALVRAGRCGEARRLLEARLDRRPSPIDTRRLAGVPG
ncbi:FAD/NAD(P)-binding protein [Lapillicoccus jejuensis]|uniref:Putative NAD(P)/FAD-binding protein YdhS n=1 Tax=Lapillicoccus jejuensis TaxID=402171 RepID=A0A542E0P4_9MICO|nr:FAD/NAD(P)-binding protein [Lapillicoccus jejuensis]TQJ08764.1 putative NAD(P)/FAD-binding protein YdhS [Lapillicoccus jejuensis]